MRRVQDASWALQVQLAGRMSGEQGSCERRAGATLGAGTSRGATGHRRRFRLVPAPSARAMSDGMTRGIIPCAKCSNS